MSATWDQSTFNRTLKEYAERNRKRTLPQILNTKLWFIARAATWFTKKADRGQIESQLGKFTVVKYTTKSGKSGSRRKFTLAAGRSGAPAAALIINARRGKQGKPGLFGRAMAQASRKMVGARIRSRSFIVSGFLPAIKKLAGLADRRGAPMMDGSSKQIGRPKGDATPAKPGWKIKSMLENKAFGNRGNAVSKSRAMRVGEEGLGKGFSNEEKSMREYMDRSMKPDADRFNRQQR